MALVFAGCVFVSCVHIFRHVVVLFVPHEFLDTVSSAHGWDRWFGGSVFGGLWWWRSMRVCSNVLISFGSVNMRGSGVICVGGIRGGFAEGSDIPWFFGWLALGPCVPRAGVCVEGSFCSFHVIFRHGRDFA